MLIILIITFFFYESDAKIREGVIKSGIKMWPKVEMKSGKSSPSCPESHPFSFDGYTKCCLSRYAKFDPLTDSNFDGKELLPHHNEHSCPGDDFIPCDGGKCRTNKNFRYVTISNVF